MKQPGRLAAAMEVVAEILARNRPAAEALHDWGKAHRFAGSTDRHAIGTLVYDTLRRRNSAAALMDADTPRALVLGAYALAWNRPMAEIESQCAEQYGPGALSAEERQHLAAGLPDGLSLHVQGDYPPWLEAELQLAFGPRLVAEMQAQASRAPIDLRANTLKTSRADLLGKLTRFSPVPTPLSPMGLRIAAPGGEGKHANVEAEPAHGLGLFEVQDEASQLAVMLAGAEPGQSVLDLCAGAGGKTLALAAMMQNRGKLVAHDRDRHRLRPIFERIGRSGATCIDVIAAEDSASLQAAAYDLVVVDAPCTGSGTWRRKPDAKWRLGQKQLDMRLNEQRAVLDQAAGLVRPGGRLAYFTCSVLPSENGGQVQAFLQRHREFRLQPVEDSWRKNIGAQVPSSADGKSGTLQLTPASHGTDGFFLALLQRH